MKHKTNELEGELLDAAVAKAEGENLRPSWWMGAEPMAPFSYSEDWEYAGPIIEKHGIGVMTPCAYPSTPGSWWEAELCYDYDSVRATNKEAKAKGQTPLVAAMRAYVLSKFGDEVELP